VLKVLPLERSPHPRRVAEPQGKRVIVPAPAYAMAARFTDTDVRTQFAPLGPSDSSNLPSNSSCLALEPPAIGLIGRGIRDLRLV